MGEEGLKLKEVKLYVKDANGAEIKAEPVEWGQPEEIKIDEALKEVRNIINTETSIEIKMNKKDKKRLVNIVVAEMAKKSNDSFSKMCNNIKREKRVDKEKEVRRFLRENRKKDEGRISRKRFKKLLYSIGYGRKEVEEIIGVEFESKGYYDIDDFRCWNMMKYED